jgi:hypothetical protein
MAFKQSSPRRRAGVSGAAPLWSITPAERVFMQRGVPPIDRMLSKSREKSADPMILPDQEGLRCPCCSSSGNRRPFSCVVRIDVAQQ